MAALMILTGHGIKAGTQANVEIAHFPTWAIIRIWKALSLRTHASQAPVMHLVGKCATPIWTWALAIYTTPSG